MQRAITIGLDYNKNNSDDSFLIEMEELKELVISCEITVIETIIQKADEINSKTYVGSGKLNEIKQIIDDLNLDVAIFNDELTPAQINNIQNVLDILVFDRTFIILEIFKRRAHTKEAILQVDIASLRYLSPRLKTMRSGFSRQRSATSEHSRGAGETKLELDRRHVSDRISHLKKELKELANERSLQRKKRKESSVPIVSLVGYTNSGKSSTLNAIMKYSSNKIKQVETKNMLFATLETASRSIRLNNNHEFILTDTVGFVSKLPHTLVESFKSTLEEITEADLIIHVVDASNPNFENQINTTNEVLKEIGVTNINTIYAFNKIDKVENYLYIPPQFENCIRISASNDTNIDILIKKIEELLYQDDKTYKLLIPYDKSSIINLLKEKARILNMEYEDDGIIIEAIVSTIIYSKVKNFIQNTKK